MTVIAALASMLLGGVFLASALPKLGHPRGFIVAVLEYHVLPPTLGRIYAVLVPPLELLLALLVLTGTAVRAAALTLMCLLLSFVLAVSVNIARGRDMDCHCFGNGIRRKVGPDLLLQDLFLTGVAALLTNAATSWWGSEPWSVFRLVPLPAMGPVIVCCGLATFVAGLLRFGGSIRRAPKLARASESRSSASMKGASR